MALQGKMAEFTIVVEGSAMGISSRRKIRKDIVERNDTINQLNIIDTYSCFIQQQQNTQSSRAHVEHSPRAMCDLN